MRARDAARTTFSAGNQEARDLAGVAVKVVCWIFNEKTPFHILLLGRRFRNEAGSAVIDTSFVRGPGD